MSSTTAFRHILEETTELRPFPAVAARLLKEINDVESSAGSLATLISADPVIASNLLRIANSSLYGFPGQILTIDHAIVVMGRRQVCNLGVSLSAGALFTGNDSVQKARHQLWRHSIGCASVARVLARHVVGRSENEAFLAAVMHDVGKIVFYDVLNEEYCHATSAVSSGDLVSFERTNYGLSHQCVGQRCADEWGLPYEISEAISSHHIDPQAGFASQTTAIVAAANLLAKHWGLGENNSITLPDISGLLASCELDIQVEYLPELQSEAQAVFRTFQELCGG